MPHPFLDRDPTPEFQLRCVNVMRAWEGGTLNFTGAAEQLSALKSEALARQHAANQAYAELLRGTLQMNRVSYDQSIRHFRDARELFEQVGNRECILICDMYMGESYRCKGELDRARGVFRRAYATAKELKNRRSQLICRAQEGRVLFEMGQYQEAIPPLQEAIQLSYTPTLLPDHTSTEICAAYSDLALIYLEQGDPKAALENARAAMYVAEEGKTLFSLGMANRTLGIVLSVVKAPSTGRLINPDDYFEAAAKYFRQLRAESELAHTAFAHGESLAKRRQKIEAATKFQEALEAYTRLNMSNEAAKANDAYARMIRGS
mgnify:CR=1 FL=1